MAAYSNSFALKCGKTKARTENFAVRTEERPCTILILRAKIEHASIFFIQCTDLSLGGH